MMGHLGAAVPIASAAISFRTADPGSEQAVGGLLAYPSAEPEAPQIGRQDFAAAINVDVGKIGCHEGSACDAFVAPPVAYSVSSPRWYAISLIGS